MYTALHEEWVKWKLLFSRGARKKSELANVSATEKRLCWKMDIVILHLRPSLSRYAFACMLTVQSELFFLCHTTHKLPSSRMRDNKWWQRGAMNNKIAGIFISHPSVLFRSCYSDSTFLLRKKVKMWILQYLGKRKKTFMSINGLPCAFCLALNILQVQAKQNEFSS